MNLKIFGKSVLIAFGLIAIGGGGGALCANHPWLMAILLFIALTIWAYKVLSEEREQ